MTGDQSTDAARRDLVYHFTGHENEEDDGKCPEIDAFEAAIRADERARLTAPETVERVAEAVHPQLGTEEWTFEEARIIARAALRALAEEA